MARQVALIPLVRCEICQGQGVIKGIFHVMDCAGCNGAGLIDRATNEALSAMQMVQQLRVRLNRANKQVVALTARLELGGLAGGPAQDYIGMNNRRGNCGGNRTGD
jgi:RecJ-like exonuclease